MLETTYLSQNIAPSELLAHCKLNDNADNKLPLILSFKAFPADRYAAVLEVDKLGNPRVHIEGDADWLAWEDFLIAVDGLYTIDAFASTAIKSENAYQLTNEQDLPSSLANRLLEAYGSFNQDDPWRHQPESMVKLAEAIMSNNDRPDFYGIVSATGTGKTRMQAMLLHNAQKIGAKKNIYVTSNIDLIPNAKREFDKYSKEYGWSRTEASHYSEKSEWDDDTDIIYTTYDSLPKLLEEMMRRGEAAPFIVADEGDNLRLARRTILGHPMLQNESMLVSFTATPGVTAGQRLEDVDIPNVFTLDINEGMRRGILCPVRIHRYFHDRNKMSRTQAILEVAPQHFVEKETGYMKKTVIQTANIDEANELYFELMQDPRYAEVRDKIAISHSRRNSEVREDVLEIVDNNFVLELDDAVQRMNSDELEWLIIVDKGTVGIDIRSLEVVYKQMKMSDTKPFQMIGRGTRIDPNNPNKVLDIVTSYPVPNPEALGYPTELLLFGIRDYEPGCIYNGDQISYRNEVAWKRERGGSVPDQSIPRLELIRYEGELSITGNGADISSFLEQFPTPQNLFSEVILQVTEFINEFMQQNYNELPTLSEVQEGVLYKFRNQLQTYIALTEWLKLGQIQEGIESLEDLITLALLNSEISNINRSERIALSQFDIRGELTPRDYLNNLQLGIENALQRLIRANVESNAHNEYLVYTSATRSVIQRILGEEVEELERLLELVNDSSFSIFSHNTDIEQMLRKAEKKEGVAKLDRTNDFNSVESLRAYLFTRLSEAGITDITTVPNTTDSTGFLQVFGLTPSQFNKIVTMVNSTDPNSEKLARMNILFSVAVEFDNEFNNSLSLYWDMSEYSDTGEIYAKDFEQSIQDLGYYYEQMRVQNLIPEEYSQKRITKDNFFQIFPPIASYMSNRMPKYYDNKMNFGTNATLNNYCRKTYNVSAAEFLNNLNSAIGF